MNYFELYPGDYLRDTAHLGLAEHGAYLKFMLSYYGQEKPLPASYPALYQIASAVTAGDKEAVRKVADMFFPIGPDGLRHKNRIDEEIAKAQKRIRIARENGSKHQPKNNPAGYPAGMLAGDPEATRRLTHSGEALHTPHATIEAKSPNGDSSAASAADLSPPECPHTEIIALYHRLLPTLPRVREWTPARQQALRSRWRESEKRQALGWWEEFFQYVAKSDFLMGRTNGRNGPFECDLEWLIKRANMVKTIEGKYENKAA